MSDDGDRREPAPLNNITAADVTAPEVGGTDYRVYLDDEGGDPGDFDVRGRWDDILTPHGWAFESVDDGQRVWTLPAGGGDLHYARSGLEGAYNDGLEIHSAPLPLGAPTNDYLGKFQAFALLNHGGLDVAAFRAAAQALRLLGYAEDDLSAAREADRSARMHQNATIARPATAEADSWSPVDLGAYLDGAVPHVEPSVGLARGDGLRLLYPGKEHAVIGEMESGKSWFCLASAAAELNAGHIVMYAHFEECDPDDTVQRLLALGVTREAIRRLFRFVGPDRALSRGLELRPLLDPAPTLAVFDGVNEGMALHDHAIRDEDGAAAFRRLLVKPFTKVGAATLSADHVVKDPEHRGRYALGSVHKANALSGALVVLENAEPFGRGARGRSKVSLVKDRPGYLRQHGQQGKAAKTFLGDLVVDATGPTPSTVILTFEMVTMGTDAPGEQPDSQQGFRVTVDAHVLEVVESITGRNEQASVSKVRGGSRYGTDTTVAALQRLVDAGKLTETEGARKARVFIPTRPGGSVRGTGPEAQRPDLTTRPLKGAGVSGRVADPPAGRVRSGQVGSTSINGSTPDPSAQLIGEQRSGQGWPPAQGSWTR